MDSFYCVIDPITASILEDIMWTSTARELCDWARGHDSIEATRNLRIHTNAHDAEQDVHKRIARFGEQQCTPAFDLGSEIESWLSDLDEVEKFEVIDPLLPHATQMFGTLKSDITFSITIIKYKKP